MVILKAKSKIATSGTKGRVSDFQLKDEVKKVAYSLYTQRGYRHGHDREDWFKAEKIVKSKFKL